MILKALNSGGLLDTQTYPFGWMRWGLFGALVFGGMNLGIGPGLSLALGDEESGAPQPATEWSEEDIALGSQVMDVLEKECLQCHNPKKRKGQLDLSTRELWFAGREGDPIFDVNNLCNSAVLVSFNADADPHMPPKGQLADEEISLFRKWIVAGLPWAIRSVDDSPEAQIPLPIFSQSEGTEGLSALPLSYRPVFASAMSPDGRWLASGYGSEILLWNVSGAKPELELRTTTAFQDAVRALAWSPNGQSLVAGSFRKMSVWHVQEAAQETETQTDNEVKGESEGGADGKTQPSEALTMELVQSFSERAMVTAIVWGRLGSGDEAKERVWVAEGFPTQPAWVREWDPENWTETRSWKAHEDTILDMDLNSDGSLLATASADRLAKLWELGGIEEENEAGTKAKGTTAPNSRNMEAHAGQVWSIAFHPNGESIVTGSGDQEIKVWDVAAAAPTQSIQRILSGVTGVGWLDEGKEIFAICEDGAPRICRPDRDRPERKLSRHGEGLRALAVTPDGKRWFGAGLDSVIYEWDTRGRLKNEMKSAEVTE